MEKVLALLFLLATTGIGAQGQVATPSSGEPQQVQPAQPDNETGAPRHGTKANPFFVNAEVATEETKEDARRRAQEEKEFQDAQIEWARTASLIAAAMFAAALGQIGLFFGQLRMMRKTTEDAAIAAKAAQKSADTAERTLTNLERPYIYIYPVGKTLETDVRKVAQETQDPMPFLRFVIANYGKLPAVIEYTFSAISDRGPPGPGNPNYEVGWIKTPRVIPSQGICELKEPIDRHIFVNPAEIHINIYDWTVSVPIDFFFRAVVRYRGPFTEGHETSTCVCVSRNNLGFVIAHGGPELNYEK